MTITQLNSLKTVELRKIARGMRITELPSGRKVNAGRKEELVQAIIEAEDARQAALELEELQEAGLKAEAELEAGESIAANAFEEQRKRTWDAGVAKAKEKVEAENRASLEKAARKRIRTQKCEVCGVNKIDAKTQGLDSTMCTGCFDKAGLENEHLDGCHEDAPNTGCPMCETEPTGQMLIGHAKAARLAAFAEEHGWSVAYATNEADGGNRHVLEIFSASGDVFFEIVWFGRVYQYDLSSYRQNGKKSIKVRNVSAARQIIAA